MYHLTPGDAADTHDGDADGDGSKKRKQAEQAEQTVSLGDVGPALTAFAEVIFS